MDSIKIYPSISNKLQNNLIFLTLFKQGLIIKMSM